MTPHRLLITGAAGEVGSALRELLRGPLGQHFPIIRLTDNRDLGAARPGEEVMLADLTDFNAVLKVMQGVDAVIHLAGIPDEDSYANIRAVNIDGTYHVLEAARQAGVRRVAFASSIHTVGFYPRTEIISPTVPVRPDTYYGVSKVFGEALGRMYWERYGLEFVGVRICSFQPRPKDRRHLSTWLSPRDATQLFARAVTAPDVGFLVVAGISGNTRRWMSPEGWDVLGYVPQDDAERFAAEVEHIHGNEGDITEQRQGGIFVDAHYHGRAQTPPAPVSPPPVSPSKEEP
ncbi:NAD-dependent epimerase/dehydratase family protein [Deinococcus radiodurans]|jgi:Nucleoside-diphosphate-sugar epimerases|uniref:TDP-glucose-4,6-dehydratase-related protein n=1 Tax=Deinococcus radiodurans (strain ATCC 13939 / DSM 20539 / JCM 16871 / CCUG 27074 / LMG 4051 / NBRC 15346 / NCIMB 9279 / VKM B-1422 / R1) TaxID=243230 RepID=Q9RYT6_DEIRA|nr:NAD(P)-dependent oxidoreductase [Deinococcus radiodurans]AAF12411.1 TDP-glucose-4,6-dehydratase-related protein [Deinococcus radiodurans R1 = ATCC 13939 = DSM 20539]ANC73070.1 TDP-glucose-4,6-dehydratase [Deinococcus radiodurans R1 = ATCC 13939 = DSM 20539]QEM73024.1 NAD(P)-dependent oxidoreductase [Deinococcus radiodurans]QIP30296.1 NAD(P)-dependent oxidoreductase [Deinococcus radiodurans]QIP33347.1 NAD(P)-dependent oxidoreductase [Deinococcus radiodurans]